MKGIILDRGFSEVLIEPKNTLSTSSKLNESLFALLLYEKAYIPSEFSQKNSKYLNELINNDLASLIPDKFFKNQEKSVLKTVSAFQKNHENFISLANSRVDRLENNLADKYERQISMDEYADNAKFYKGNELCKLMLNKEIVWEYYKQTKIHKKIKYSPKDLATFAVHYPQYLCIDERMSFAETIALLTLNKEEFKIELKEEIQEFYQIETDEISPFELDNLLQSNSEMNFEGYSEKRKLEALRKILINNNFDFFDLNIERLHFLNQYSHFKELTSFSSEMKIPIKGQVGLINANDVSIPTDKDNAYSIYKIILDEINYIPKLHSIEDVMRLKNDKRIADFRDVINEWSIAVNVGDVNQVLKLKKNIRLANSEFKKLANYRKVGGWVTYISLPFIIVDMLIGIPIGTILTTIGGITQFQSDQLNKKHQWLLLGNRL